MNQFFIRARYKDGETEQEFGVFAILFFWNKTTQNLKFTDILGNEDELSNVTYLDISLTLQQDLPFTIMKYNPPN